MKIRPSLAYSCRCAAAKCRACVSGQLTVAYEAWVQADVFGLRASACIRRGKQLAHNGLCA